MAGNNRIMLILADDGSLFSMGKDTYKTGMLGIEKQDFLINPCPIGSLLDHKIISVSIGTSHVVALTLKGDLYSWGSGTCGELGQGNLFKKSDIPIKMANKVEQAIAFN